MDLRTVLFTEESGWSEPLPIELDSERTLVLAFRDPRLVDAPSKLEELARA